MFPDRDAELAAFVRSRRQANGMTLRELAELAGVGVRFLMELEHGKRTLRLDRVNAVLAVLGKRVGVVDLERD
ncbi:MAG: helix-turn-helix transcriptional regulator [Phycisphaerales bacterium]|nr:helix-turn-helix transcriptional regulator [Phycisphaerales bacterium]